MSDRPGSISKIFGTRRLKGIPDIRTFFRTNEQPVFFVGPTAFNLLGIDRWVRNTVMMPTPVRCAVRPGALRVRVPRDRPGVRPPKPRIDWQALRALASLGSAPVGAERQEMPV